jgi:ferredoxin-NADP reductase
MNEISLTVTEARLETQNVRRIILSATDGSRLPTYTAGSSIAVKIPGIGRRKYSLVNAEAQLNACMEPERYMLGVRLSEDSQGGSSFMHGLQVGDIIHASLPDNDFALNQSMGPVLLIGGGIGITPLISKAALMKAQQRPFRFIYAARSSQDFAFLDEIKALAEDRLILHNDAKEGKILDLATLLQTAEPETVIHICGPKPMVKSAIDAGRQFGWPSDKIRFELFYSLGPETEQPAAPTIEIQAAPTFEIELKSTGAVFQVPADKSIIDVLVEAGLDPLFDCNKGECGVCQVGVLAGIPDHRDFILSDTERAANKFMQICVSRSKSGRLVLDL